MPTQQLPGQDFIDSYIKWIKSNMKSTQIKEYTAITTPFLDRHNDCIEIYVKQEGDKIHLTDDGYIINDIEASGCDLSSPRRQEIMKMLAASVGVKINNGALMVDATRDTFAQKKHALIQAMLSVSDMLLLSRGNIMSIFLEEVTSFFDSHNILYTPSIQFSGKSGLTHGFDFVLPRTQKHPERVIRTINSPNRQNAESALFAWSDIRETRSANSKMLVFLNDEDKKVNSSIKNAFVEYGILPVLWSDRGKSLNELVS